MKMVLVVADYYVPAQKGGGAARSLETQVEAIGGEIEFNIITRDRDLGDSRPYDGMTRNVWVRVEQANVYYARSGLSAALAFWRALRQMNPGFVYLASVVAIWYSIVPILLLRISSWISDRSRHQLILAPRGQFGAGALRVKGIRKRVYLAVSRMIGFHSGIIWHASSPREADEIRQWLGKHVRIRVAMDIWKPRFVASSQREKPKGSASIVHVSRISPEKNLLVALQLLARVSGRAEFTIYGPVVSNSYWDSCQLEMAKLPKNIMARYGGPLPAKDVLSAFGQAHLFFFPTTGENFGHVILEALSAGCPVLCSDRTPWGAIAAEGAGWVESLDQPDRLVSRVQDLIEMDQPQWQQVSSRALEFAKNYAARSNAIQENRDLFNLIGSNAIEE